VDRMRVYDASNRHAGIHERNFSVGTTAKVSFLRGGAVPSAAQSAGRNQADIAVRHKSVGLLALVAVHLVVYGDAQTVGGLDNTANLSVGHVRSVHVVHSQVAVLDGIGSCQQIERVGVHNGRGELSTGRA